jgi:hypothetical protein
LVKVPFAFGMEVAVQLSAILWRATDAAVAKGKRRLSDAIIQAIVESGKKAYKSLQVLHRGYAGDEVLARAMNSICNTY